MRVLDGITCTDGYAEAATIAYVYDSGGGYFAVSSHDTYAQLQYGKHGFEQWTPEVHVPVGSGILNPGTIGIRFRNYVAGSAAVVSAALSLPTEPTFAIGAGGIATPTPPPTVSGIEIYDRATTLASFNTSTAENTLYSKLITGGDMGTDGALRLTLLGYWRSQSTSANTFTFRVYFGGSAICTVASDAFSSGAGTPYGALALQLMLQNLGAANVQDLSGFAGLNRTGGIATATTTAHMDPFFQGTADLAVDTTADQTLAVTCQMSNANTNNIVACRSALLELLLPS